MLQLPRPGIRAAASDPHGDHPAGVDNGMQVRITGEGDAGANGGPPGNLYVQVRVREHPFFVRDESDLLYRTSLNMAEAALGITKPIPTLEGDDVDLEIPPGTQAGSEFRVRSRGAPRIRRDGGPRTDAGTYESWWTWIYRPS